MKILLIESDPKELQSLTEKIHNIESDAEIISFTNPLELLDRNEVEEIHMVIADIVSSTVNDMDILEVIKDKFPSTIRVGIFDESNELNLLLKTVISAHMFIPKPVDESILAKSINQAKQLNGFLQNENLRKIINSIDALPVLPKTYMEIEKELKNDSFSLAKISSIIQEDFTISSRIIQIVNSPLFGLPRTITDINQAVNMIGITMIKSLILYVQIFSSFDNNMRVENLHREIWEHSLKVAKNSKAIISNLGDKRDAETTYIAGLLHDIGKIIVINNEDYILDIFDLMKSENISYNEAEKKILNTTHAEIGAYLLSLWGLPQTIVDAILNHHNIKANEENKINIGSAVYIANQCSDKAKIENSELLNSKFNEILDDILEVCEN